MSSSFLSFLFLTYLYSGKLRAFAYLTLSSILFILLPAIYLGWDLNLEFLNGWWESINPTKAEFQLETGIYHHSLTALKPSLLSATEGELELKRNLISLNTTSAVLLMNIARAVLIVSVLWFLPKPFKAANIRLSELRGIAYILLLVPLIFPHQPKYAFAFIIPSVFYLGFFISKLRLSKRLPQFKLLQALVITSFVVMVFSSDLFLGKELGRIAQHFKLLTWGSLLLIPALLIAAPKKLDGFRTQDVE